MKKYAYYLIIAAFIFSVMPFAMGNVKAVANPSPGEASTPSDHLTGLQPPETSQRYYLPLIHNGRYKKIVEDSIFGVESGSVRSENMELMSEAGTKWVRVNGLFWSQAEPVQGQIDWQSETIKKMELELDEANKQGYELIYIVRTAPVWARQYPSSECGPIREDKLDAFGDFMAEMVTYFSSTRSNLVYWEMGNEPDAPINDQTLPFGCWGVPEDEYYGGGYYGEMLKRVYPKMKAANPDIQVLVGGLLLDCDPINPPETSPGQFKDCRSSKFLEGILKNGGGPYFDGVSFHGYEYYQGALGHYSNSNWHSSWDTTGPVIDAKIDYIKNVLWNYQQGGKYIVSTEVAMLCDTNCTEDFEATKANYLAQVYADASFIGLRANIWYDVNGSWRNSGLIDHGEPLPAYNAFQTSHMEIADPDAIIDVSDGWLRGYEFQFPDRRVWVIWAQDGSSHTYTLPGTPYRIKDIYGNNLPVSQVINVNYNTLYIEWLP